jgi:acetyl-CoA synthetase (ADP-forming)
MCPGGMRQEERTENMIMISQFIEKNKGRSVFLEHEAKGMLRDAGFSVPKGIFLKPGETLPGDASLSYPLVAKVSSPKIVSKSDVHGVRTGIRDKNDLASIVRELMKIRDAEGVLIEEMAPTGIEVIVGGVIDRQFGPVMMFGLGGISVELFKDVAFALAPLSLGGADWLIRQVKGYRLLEGFRGRAPVHVGKLLEILVAVSEMMATGLIDEIDLNPVALYPDGAVILDAKLSVREA